MTLELLGDRSWKADRPSGGACLGRAVHEPATDIGSDLKDRHRGAVGVDAGAAQAGQLADAQTAVGAHQHERAKPRLDDAGEPGDLGRGEEALLVLLDLGQGDAPAVSVALNVAHAPERLAAQLFAALPPVALLGALELLMSVARTGLPHTDRGPATATTQAGSVARTQDPGRTAATTATDRTPAAGLPGRTASAGNGSGPQRDSRARVRELVERERASGTRLAASDVAAAVGISQRRAYELLRDLRAQG